MNDNNSIDIKSTSAVMRWIPTIMLVSVVTGFVMIAYYSYHSDKQPVKEDELLVIEAEKTPVKEKPEDPGGMKFPNQDKTIFETFSNTPDLAKVERVLPLPEEPITSIEQDTKLEPSSGTSVNSVTESAKESDKTDSRIDESGGSKQRISFNDNSENAKDNNKNAATPVEVAKIEAVGVNDKKPETAKQAETKNSSAKSVNRPEKTVEAKAVAKPVAKTGGIKIQLGAYASEKEANETWQKIQKKFSSMSGRTPIVVRAAVKGKTFYRLRVGGFSSKEAAKELCKSLTAKGQGCILATD